MTREDYFDKAVADSLPHWFLAAATVTFVYFLVEPGIIAPELRIKVAVVRCILFLGTLLGYFRLQRRPLGPTKGHPVFLGHLALYAS